MTTAAPTAPPEVRAKLAVALDVDDAVAALRLARELQPGSAWPRSGLELYSAAGPDVVGALADLGYDVFCDLKLHDIPTTVGRAAGWSARSAPRYLNFHAQGGVPMLTRRRRGLPRRRRRGRAADARSRSPSRSSPATATRRRTSSRKRVQAALEAGCARRRVRRRPTCAR